MEILDLYSDDFKFLNETINRGEIPAEGKNIMLSVVYIKNDKDEFLIQKTSKQKGNIYSTTGGHVMHNENGIETIVRELKEEIGLEISVEQLEHVITFKYPKKPCIFNVYILKKDIIDHICLQKEEVESVTWMTKEQIEDLIIDNKFLESHAYIYHQYILT